MKPGGSYQMFSSTCISSPASSLQVLRNHSLDEQLKSLEYGLFQNEIKVTPSFKTFRTYLTSKKLQLPFSVHHVPCVMIKYL